MKAKVTKRQVMNETMCISVPYCTLQYLLVHESPVYYTSGRYGWNADIYMVDGVAIVTGYRPFGNLKVEFSVIHKYNRMAKEIISKQYPDSTIAINMLLRDFINECIGFKK